MRTPTIMRTVVADIHGDILYDSAAPRCRRIASIRPTIVRRRAAPQQPVEPAGERALSALLAGLAVALAASGVMIAVALAVVSI